jgi:hypothetical protein
MDLKRKPFKRLSCLHALSTGLKVGVTETETLHG